MEGLETQICADVVKSMLKAQNWNVRLVRFSQAVVTAIRNERRLSRAFALWWIFGALGLNLTRFEEN